MAQAYGGKRVEEIPPYDAACARAGYPKNYGKAVVCFCAHCLRGLKGLVFARYGRQCYLCGANASTIDHVVPRCDGGGNSISNLRPCCYNCNNAKGNLALSVYLKVRENRGLLKAARSRKSKEILGRSAKREVLSSMPRYNHSAPERGHYLPRKVP